MKKALNIVKNILVWLVVALAVFMMIFTVFSVSSFDKTDRDIFGYKFFVVQTDSMSKTDFDAGDIVIIKEVDPSTLKAGDIIAFISQNSANYGETVTHKIREVTTDANGNAGFVTYGTTTDTNDEAITTYPYVLGKYTGKISDLGKFFAFLKTTPGYIICILIPFLLLILYQGVNCIAIFRRYKKEQLDEMEKERAKIEEERRQSLEMMKELQELKAQLEAKSEKGENVTEGENAEENKPPEA